MRIIDVDGMFHESDITKYIKAIGIDFDLVRSIKIENSDI